LAWVDYTFVRWKQPSTNGDVFNPKWQDEGGKVVCLRGTNNLPSKPKFGTRLLQLAHLEKSAGWEARGRMRVWRVEIGGDLGDIMFL
jgi:hypothetical protein